MNIALWIVQGLIALMFLMAGAMKLTQPRERLLERMTFVEDFPTSTVRLIGLVEVLGALGLILPAATGILPFLTPLAAVGLVIVQIGAFATHLRRSESPIGNVVLALLITFIAVGRFMIVPVA